MTTFLEARSVARSLGFTLTRRPDGEFRLNCLGGSEATAYYTNDLDDAIGTARIDARRQEVKRFPPIGATHDGYKIQSVPDGPCFAYGVLHDGLRLVTVDTLQEARDYISLHRQQADIE